MEIKVLRNELKEAVVSTKKALPKIIIQEERSHLLFNVEGPLMKVSGTNNDLKALRTIKITNETNKNFAFTVNPKTLEKLLIKMDADEVRLDLDNETLVLKVYTTEGGSSFTSFQSFPPDKMLTIGDSLKAEKTTYQVNKEIFVSSMKYAFNYMSSLKEDHKMFDFITINKGIVYGANGSNKMGFLIFKAFSQIKDYKIRKAAAPTLIAFATSIKEDTITLIETDKNIGIESADGSAHFSCLKSTVDSPDVPMHHVKSDGPYIQISKSALVKVVDRLVVTNTTAGGSGIEMTLSGTGEDSYLDLSLVSSLKNNERIKVTRVNDDEAKNVTHVVEYNLFKSVLTSLNSKKDVRFHIVDNDKFFKMYDSGEMEEEKYIAVSVGSYSKVVNQ